MLCKCGQPAELRSIYCRKCNANVPKRAYQRDYMQQRRAGYDPSDFEGKRAELRALAQRLGLVR